MFKSNNLSVIIERAGIIMGVRNSVRLCFILVSIIVCIMICADSRSFNPSVQSNNNAQIDDVPAKLVKISDNNISNNHSLSNGEELIKHQGSQLDIVESSNIMPIKPIDPENLAKIDEELHRQANLSASFEDILMEEWPQLSESDRINSTIGLEDLLKRQAVLLESYQTSLKTVWCLLEPIQEQKFTLSYEDLLKSQSDLLLKFEDFLHLQQNLNQSITARYLTDFEDLIRREADLLDSLEDLMKVKCTKLRIAEYSDKNSVEPGEKVNYTYIVSNEDDSSINNVTIIDDKLGTIAKSVELGPKESISFSKPANINGSCGSTILNKAEVFGVDSMGFLLHGLSQNVSIKVACGKDDIEPINSNIESINSNIASVNLGSLNTVVTRENKSIAKKSAENIKNQKRRNQNELDSSSHDEIWIGDQTASANGNGCTADNNINIE